MTTNRPMRGMAVLAAGALVWGIGAAPASADTVRDGQWPLNNYHATKDVWPISQGEGVTVAVIDSGVAEHQDLSGQVLPGTDCSGEGLDYKTDKVGHGTAMASLIAGHGHGDQAGVMGLAPKAKILPVRIGTFDVDSGSMVSGNLAECLRYAVDHGARVINMSISGSSAEAGVRDAVKYAVEKDVVVVASAGNTGGDHPVEYPSAFPGVVSVGAVDQQGNIWSKSNSGPEVTLAAPGVDIYSATAKSSSSYGKGNGTSGAAAYVSAIAALVRSKYPNLSAGQVINRMIKSAIAPPDKSPVPNSKYGYGIASAKGALAPNPAVDNGPKENPLLTRVESQADPSGKPSSAASKPAPGNSTAPGDSSAAKEDGGIPVYVLAIVGVLALVVIGGVIVLVRRSRGNGSGGGGNGGGGGGFVPPTPPPYGPGAQQFPPQQQAPYAGQGQPQQSSYVGQGNGQPQQFGSSQPYQQYPPQQPPAGGSPYS
ncbi:type VII secretion-associated serine protease mycosin [Kitasatospora sp. NPDC007106]|uniref:type VII secretion-associated serine protease mycosin n=1 Tax=Kitasatospora sp. NPDC007106 TaxID=3156914 RepID=UPI0033F86A0D